MTRSHLHGIIADLDRKRGVGHISWVEGERLMVLRVLRVSLSLRRGMFDEVWDLIDHGRGASTGMSDIGSWFRQ